MGLKRGGTCLELSDILVWQFNKLHKVREYSDAEIEREYYRNVLESIKDFEYVKEDRILYKVSPSSAGKCQREMFYKNNKAKKDVAVKHSYHQRWTRNATAVHEATQKDILYFEKHIDNPRLVIARTEDNKPMWEENIKTDIIIQYKGTEIRVVGMMDGILLDTETGENVGFEFKTKSNTIAQVGDYKLREPAEYHVEQCVLYSLMFDINTFIIMYEALSKDYWTKGGEAKPDIKAFTINVTPRMQETLLDKIWDTANKFYDNIIPEKEPNKCLFCQYKNECGGI